MTNCKCDEPSWKIGINQCLKCNRKIEKNRKFIFKAKDSEKD